MQLPPALRAALAELLEGTTPGDLRQASARLTERYRAETRDGTLHLSDERAARAYCAARMPATFAALRASCESVAEVLPDFRPASLLDAGAGPASALWAAHDCWPDLAQAELWEASPAIRHAGEALLAGSGLPQAVWRKADLADPASLRPDVAADLVTLSYVLDELDPTARAPLVTHLWEATAGVLLIVEPGTPAGWRRILEARDTLLSLGARIAAPCPHERPCPVAPPDWCHFARRVARSRLHRETKGAEAPFEDEKYSFVAASRLPVTPPEARVLAPPRAGSGKVALKLCRMDGRLEERLVTRRDGEAFRVARRTEWGEKI